LPDARIAFVCGIALALGLVLSQGGSANEREAGWLVASGGAGGLAWWLWRAWRAWQEAQAIRAARARRVALRLARRQRHQAERVRRKAERAARLAAEAQQAATRAAQQQNERAANRAAALRRAAQEAAIQAEITRLHTLTDAQLVAEVAALFAQRGLQPQPEPDTECDLRLRTPEGQRDVARCVPAGRIARSVDVRALETWRQAVGAQHAYLIALAGFAPAAVDLVRSLPITLIEAHLLAHWQQASETPRKEEDHA
jgi:hypothetical protein